MNISECFKIVNNFLESLIEVQDWKKASLVIEIQPKLLGLKGKVILLDLNSISLKTRPDDRVKEAIHQLHLNTAISDNTKWNFLEYEIQKDGSFSVKYIWNQEYQDEVDRSNLEVKKQHPDYNLPKWHWEI